MAINKAMEDVATKDTGTIPMHIRNAPAEGMAKEGYGVGYKYPHDYKGSYVVQQYLPDRIKNKEYYNPKSIGYEVNFKQVYDRLKKINKETK